VGRALTVSIVDDDEDVRLALGNLLRSAGFGVFAFQNAEAFLESPDRGATDCLVTDLHMPGMGGLALQEELNRQGRTFPVIVMTAFPTHDAEQRSLELGAAAFLSKPVDPDHLLERVERSL